MILSFMGRNNVFATSSENLVGQISDLANLLLTKAKRAFLLGIPLRFPRPLFFQAKEVIYLLACCQEV